MPADNGHGGFDTDEPELVAVQSEHLLKVAESVVRDASTVWAQLWGEFRSQMTPGGMVPEELSKGFVPECGWPEFLERLWLLKHYLDSISRICKKTH